MSGLRYGIIGAGMMGQEHIRNIALLEGATISAVSDPDPGMRSAARHLAGGADAFSDHRALLSADVCDAYLIAAPNDLHLPILRDVLATPKPVLVEKPLAIRSEDCRTVIQLAVGRTAPVWVAMEYRYMPPVAQLIADVHRGRVGDARMMAIREHRFPFLSKVGDWNRFNARTGGTMVEKCCHFWDLMRLVLRSDPVRVYASGGADVNHRDESYDGQRPDILDNGFVTLDFANGSRAMLDLCMFGEGSYWQEEVSVTGPLGRIDARVPGPARFSADGEERASEVEFSDRQTKRQEKAVIEVDPRILQAGDHHGSTFYQHQRFADLVRRGDGQPEVGLEDGFWSVLVGEAAEESARTGQAVSLEGRGP
ncbi:Gfo/Idh/MocA family protein [Oceanomicrobium pacificus]|uniref:Gfo/Idh/MocA family oxidoreductase n=1 Tax=Oceanomicrobium pacificus TaxID=2692916 RepID=A0A6B0TJW0_9RHOB|nr:Gfo/Idh/MocA family oxidoreductase [Oceanomicrobium pacificus]MXU64780.1 Gfo/Idh/MocA family oxidoreductase [Oceanomicrobium pacificus]